MEIILVKGDVYTVATKTECAVTSANGTPLGKATAGNPLSFTALTDRVELSDPNAEYARVNPKYAPVKLRLLGLLGGGVQTLPAGYIAAEFLDIYRSIGRVPIFTVSPETLKPEIEAVVRMREDSYSDYNFLTDDNHQFAISLYIAWTPLMRWDYAGELFTKGALSPNKIYTVRKVGEKNYVDGALICENSKKTLSTTKIVYLTGSYTPKFALYSLKADNSVDEKRDFMPALTSEGKPCLFDKVSKQTFEVSCGVGFTLDQARNLSKLPATGGTLTVSLPWEAQLVQHNADVESALQTAKNNGWTITVQYREPEADSAVYNKYAACTTVSEMRAVTPDYKNDLTAAGEWIYPLSLISNAHDMLCENSKLTAVSVNLPMCTNGVYAFAYCPNLKSFSGSLQSLQNGFQMFNNSRQFKHFDASIPALSNGQTMFNYCILDKDSALNVLNSIPTYTSGSHLLTIGIHIDHQTDEEVIAAIDTAETKGWNVTVQWNGSPTAQPASTFGLRSPTIYAKLGTVARPDGTTENVLDWGHYVTDWEANGYREFGSVEEAKEYFNIIDEA